MVLLLISDQDMFSDFCLRLHPPPPPPPPPPNVITNLSVTYCSVTDFLEVCVCLHTELHTNLFL